MEQFRRLGFFLNESPADEVTLAFAGGFASLAGCESVLCIHVRGPAKSADAPDPDPAEFDRRIRTKLPADVASRTKVEVHTGSGIPEVLRSARDLELDLIVLGRRLPADQMGIGSAFNRLARKSPCNVLVVPEHARPHFARMLVPVDGSEHAKRALRTAIAIAKASGHDRPQVVVQSIYTVGYGYQYSGLDFHDAGRRLEEVTRKDLDKFLADVDTAHIDFETVCTCSERPEAAIQDLASARKMDVIVVGSRGATSPAVALLGSTAERVLMSSPLPVMIVKRKGETTRFLDVLLGG
jgi:nucleotide-binding universal stress UspA family protein